VSRDRSAPPPSGTSPVAQADVPLARLMAMAYRSLVDSLHEELAERGWRDVRPQYGYVLLACRERPTTSGEIAALLGVSKQAAGKLIDAMVESGLLLRRSSADDARAKPLVLSARGRRLLLTVEEVYTGIEDGWAAVIGRRRLEALRNDLDRVLRSGTGGSLPAVRPV
jgi:DNA-binding MarR family transcriptional regulator